MSGTSGTSGGSGTSGRQGHPAAGPAVGAAEIAGPTAGANPAHPAAGSTPPGDANPALSDTLTAARRDLAVETAKRETLERQIAAERQGMGNIPVVSLGSARGGGAGNAGEGGGGSLRTVALPRQGGWIALWVEPGGDDYPSYRATLRDAQGRTAFEASGLSINDLGAILLMVRSSALASGGLYRLDLDGMPKAAAPVAVGRYALKVIPAATPAAGPAGQ
jgi:hypothetical protein